MASTSSANISPKIIFEDSSILVLDKPAGLVVDKSETQATGTLENWLGNYFRHSGDDSERSVEEDARIDSGPASQRGEQARMTLERNGIVHRLDKDTSGIILVAKSQQALENLQSQFQERIVKKEYLALVHGEIKSAGKIEGAIGRNPGDREKFTVLAGGKPAVTEYEPARQLTMDNGQLTKIFEEFNKIQMRKLNRMNYNQFTLVRCFPQTGRTHQIRVHLKYIGFPIVSDEKYVGRKMYRLDKRWCLRQFLHAAKISFKHPGSGEPMEFESKLPEDLEKALGKLLINDFSYSLIFNL